jgi:long-chain acyl-CoA synthetase
MAYQPRYTNLVRLFETTTKAHADQPLFGTRGPSGWSWITYRDFAERVGHARAGLAALGVQHGDRVAVISNNRLEWAVCAYGTYTRGAVYVPMYESQHDKEWQYILRDSGAKVCFVATPVIEARVRALQADLPELSRVVCFEGASFADMMQRGKSDPVPPAEPDDGDIATFIYTSGTTGNPKGVKLSQFNLAANVSGVLEVAPMQEGERSLAFLPWAHVFGGTIELNTGMAVGGSIAICDNTDNLLGYLPEVQPTMLFAVPRIWNRIYDGVRKQIAGKPGIIQAIFEAGLRAKSKRKRGEAPTFGESIALPLAEKLVFSKIVARFGGRLRFAFSGAAALSREVGEFIDNLGIQVFEGYGLTESSGCTTASWPGACRIGAVGKPIPGVEVRLDKTATGAGEGEGEIVIYGTGVMQGYHNLPDATRESLTPDGGLRSGDLGRFDADGFLYITGRVKELFKLENGKYVAPAPLEEKLQLSPYIAQCVIHGSNKPYVVALIVPDFASLKSWAEANGVPTDKDGLLSDPRTRALIRSEIDHHSRDFKGFESVHDFVLDGEELTTANGMLTPTLKLKRRNVAAKHGARLDALYLRAQNSAA